MLVVWIGCCLLHRVAIYAHPGLLFNYGLPMCFGELKNCVIDDKLAMDAVLAVAAYVKEWTRSADLTLFSLRTRERETTIKFARSFAEGNEAMRARLQLEKKAAIERQEAGWQRVSVKKQQAIHKRQEIGIKEAQVLELKRQVIVKNQEIQAINNQMSLMIYANDGWYAASARKQNVILIKILELILIIHKITYLFVFTLTDLFQIS
jgi:ABC-type antimicrobial peptide transport system ATPase subunit